MDEEKVCIVCAATFVRPQGMAAARWRARTCCSRECGARLPRKDRYVDPDTKPCEFCGVEFPRPRTYRGHQWADRKYCSRECAGKARTREAWDRRPVKTCPVCGVEFRVIPSQVDVLHTCGDQDCQRTYRRTVVARQISETHREAYRSGKRKPGRGISPRERALWPALAAEGWVWQLKWYEWDRCFEMDFAVPARKLNVEIDGEEHRYRRRRSLDVERDAELERRSWRILRIPNEDVDRDPAGALDRILTWAE